MNTTKKLTRATIKSFIRKAGKDLLISTRSRFDGMTDCVQSTDSKEFSPALLAERYCDNNMGIQGAWFVLGSRDWFTAYDNGEVTGFEVSNCCGSFILAVKK